MFQRLNYLFYIYYQYFVIDLNNTMALIRCCVCIFVRGQFIEWFDYYRQFNGVKMIIIFLLLLVFDFFVSAFQCIYCYDPNFTHVLSKSFIRAPASEKAGDL